MHTIDVVIIAILGPGLLIWLYALGATLKMRRVVVALAKLPRGDTLPTVSIISPACNEAASIEAAVTTWLAQSDVDAQIVVVDDRSSDGTGAIIDGLAADHDHVTAVHVEARPDGWLGKLNALHHGVAEATGDWLLFADADVHFAEGAIARAVHYAETHGFDLVTAYPEIESAGLLGDLAWAAVATVSGPAGFWRSRDPDSEHAFAIGAFILVRRAAFEETPGFAWLKLEVADDMGLALLLKHHGFRCDVLNGRGQVRLRWYTSFRDMVARSQKNWFAIACRFSLARATAFTLLLLATTAVPFALLLPLTHPASIALPIAVTATIIATSTLEARWSGRPLVPALVAPLGFALVAFMVLRAGVIGVRLGGIAWRGVHYPSALLREAQRFRM
jgi:hypothetical protein